MKDTVRGIVAALIGAVVALAVVAGSPAMAHQLDKAKAKKVTSAAIKDQTIRTVDLSNEVTGPLAKASSALQQVPDNSVTSAKLSANSVTSTKIADNGVSGAKLTAGSVTTAKIGDDAVTSGKLAADSVTTAKIADGAVTRAELAAGSVTATEVADGSLRMADLAVAQGFVTLDFALLPGGACLASGAIDTGRAVRGNFLLVSQPSNVVGALQVGVRESPASASALEVVICNNNPNAVNPQEAIFHWAVVAV